MLVLLERTTFVEGTTGRDGGFVVAGTAIEVCCQELPIKFEVVPNPGNPLTVEQTLGSFFPLVLFFRCESIVRPQIQDGYPAGVPRAIETTRSRGASVPVVSTSSAMRRSSSNMAAREKFHWCHTSSTSLCSSLAGGALIFRCPGLRTARPESASHRSASHLIHFWLPRLAGGAGGDSRRSYYIFLFACKGSKNSPA